MPCWIGSKKENPKVCRSSYSFHSFPAGGVVWIITYSFHDINVPYHPFDQAWGRDIAH